MSTLVSAMGGKRTLLGRICEFYMRLQSRMRLTNPTIETAPSNNSAADPKAPPSDSFSKNSHAMISGANAKKERLLTRDQSRSISITA